jgi:hypothetical protein
MRHEQSFDETDHMSAFPVFIDVHGAGLAGHRSWNHVRDPERKIRAGAPTTMPA